MSLGGKVLVLNQNYEPLNICNIKRAVSLLYLKKAETVISHDGILLRSERLSFQKPSVVRLGRYIHIRRREIPLNKKNILKRDNYTCQYCGSRDGPMTVDHVIPKGRGGNESWENLVCACLKCNNKKGGRTLQEVGMSLLKKPKYPNYFAIIFDGKKLPDTRWRPFLFMD